MNEYELYDNEDLSIRCMLKTMFPLLQLITGCHEITRIGTPELNIYVTPGGEFLVHNPKAEQLASMQSDGTPPVFYYVVTENAIMCTGGTPVNLNILASLHQMLCGIALNT
jgi:hypothetical protein